MIEPFSQHTQSTQPTEPDQQSEHLRPFFAWLAQVKAQSMSTWKRITPVPGMSRPTRTASILQKLLQGVLWAAFGAFLFASLPHVAYFFAAFEPESNNGTLNDYWWFVSYGLAASIDVTAFLLSLNVAIKMRHVTFGLSWYQKTLAAFGVIITHWPFILLLVGFSWLVNFEHARQFHSSMLSAAEQVSINLIIWQGKLADLNPVIASSFPLLAVAYTGMADQMGEEHGSTLQGNPAHMPPATVHLAEEGTSSAHGQVLERDALLKAWQESQEHLLHSVQTMMEQHHLLMLELTQQSLAQFAEAMQTILRETREQEQAKPWFGTTHAAESRRPNIATVPGRGNQQEQLRPRDPAVVLGELMEQLPHLAESEADALQVIALYQQGLDRTKIRETLRFGTQKYSTIIKPIGDLIQAGQIVLFANDVPSAMHLPSEQTISLSAYTERPDVPTDLPILLAVPSEGIGGKEQQTTTMSAVQNMVRGTETEAAAAIQPVRPA